MPNVIPEHPDFSKWETHNIVIYFQRGVQKHIQNSINNYYDKEASDSKKLEDKTNEKSRAYLEKTSLIFQALSVAFSATGAALAIPNPQTPIVAFTNAFSQAAQHGASNQERKVQSRVTLLEYGSQRSNSQIGQADQNERNLEQQILSGNQQISSTASSLHQLILAIMNASSAG